MQQSTRGAFSTPPEDSLVCFAHSNLFPCRRCLADWKREERAFQVSVVLVFLGALVCFGGVATIIAWAARL